MRNSILALVTILLASHASEAGNKDVNDALFSRLQGSGAMEKIRKDHDVAKRLLARDLHFEGHVQSQGMQFTAGDAVPAQPLVLKHSVLHNCSSRESTQSLSVSKSTTNTHSWANSSGWSIGHSHTLSAELEFKAKVPMVGESGVTVGSSSTVSHEISGSSEKSTEVAETLEWNDSAEVPVGPREAVGVQFVVSEEKRDVPYHVDFVARGKARVRFSAEDAHFRWADPVPGEWVQKAHYPGGQTSVTNHYALCVWLDPGLVGFVTNHKGDAICAITRTDGSTTYGKVFHPDRDVKILAADPGGFAWVAADVSRPPAKAFRYRAGGKHYACGVVRKDGRYPGYNPRGSDYCFTNGKAYTTFEYLVGGEAREIDVALEDYLSAPQDRTFSVTGVYRGVLAVDSQFRVDSGRKLETCGDDEGTTHHAEKHVVPGKTKPLRKGKRAARRRGGKKKHRRHPAKHAN